MTEMQGGKCDGRLLCIMYRASGNVRRVSVSAVGNVDVPVADYNIITPHSYCLAG